MILNYTPGLLALISPYNYCQSQRLEARWLLAELLLLGGPQTRRVFSNTSAYFFDDRHLDIATIPLAAVAVLASPKLPRATDRYRTALAASQALNRYLSTVALHGGMSAALPALTPLLAMWRCQGNDLSIWAVEAALDMAVRRWDPEVHGDSPALVHELGFASPSRQTNATSAFALRFYAEQLSMLTSAGALPYSPFHAHARRLEAVAGRTLTLASANAAANASANADDSYQCYSLTDLHYHFSLPPTFGRAVYESSLPESWLLDAESTLVLNPTATVAAPSRSHSYKGNHSNDVISKNHTNEDTSLNAGWSSIADAYWASARRGLDSGSEGGGHVVVDDALDPAAARAVHAWLLKTTHWHDARHGYLGTYLDQWSSPVVLRLADELRRALPQLLRNLPLTAAWAYIYDNQPLPENNYGGANKSTGSSREHDGRGYSDGRSNGIPEHADMAAINVNLWLTPNDCAAPSIASKDSGTGDNNQPSTYTHANINNNIDDSDDGGLVVFNRKPPRNWSAETINRRPDLVRNFLYGDESESDDGAIYSEQKANGAVQQLRTSYRFNRMIIFDSLLFHRTDRHRFTQPDIACRRINLTLLFGKPANS